MLEENATFLIKSTQNKSFGTGFCFDQDEGGVYLLTCQHVVEACGEESLSIDGYQGEVLERTSSSKLIDLAVIYVKGLECVPLKLSLQPVVKGGLYLTIEGFKSHKPHEYKYEPLEGQVKKVSKIHMDNESIDTYELSIGEDDKIEKGYSGSAIVSKTSGQVIAVATDRVTTGKQAYAIPLKYLKEVWCELNPNLFDTITPFVGLSSFDREDRDYFFGRDKEVKELIQTLKSTDIMIVIGDSGSGKSSFVKAGVIPEYIDAKSNPHLHVIEMRPARNPFVELARLIAKFCDKLNYSQADIGYFMDKVKSQEAKAIQSVFEQLYKEENSQLLLYVDQFEELFTMCDDETQKKFIALLLFLLEYQSDYLPLKILLTMRRDYYNLLREYDDFYDVIEAQTYLLKRMKDEQLREVIEKPLEMLSVNPSEIEQLTNIILWDLGDEAKEITLLQIALTETWLHKAEYNHDILESYVGIGRVTGALSFLATHTLEGLTEKEQELFKYIFIRIVKFNDIGGITRRLADRDEFSDEAWELVQKLASIYTNNQDQQSQLGRLLKLKSSNTKDDDEVIELVHEALTTQWATYVSWIKSVNKENRKRIHNVLIDKSKEYKKNPEHKHLLSGYALEESRKLLDEEYRPYLSKFEKEFIEKSNKYEAKTIFWKRFGVSTLAVLCMLSLYLWQDSEKQKKIVNESLYQSNIQKGVIYRAYSNEPLKSKLIFANVVKDSLSSHQEENAKILYRPILNDRIILENFLYRVLWNKNKSIVVTIGDRYTTRIGFISLWNSDNGNFLREFEQDTFVKGVTLNKKETNILSWNDNNVMSLWNIKDGKLLQTLEHNSTLGGVSFSNNEEEILFWDDNNRSYVYDMKSKNLLKSFQFDNSVEGMFKEQERVVIWGDQNATIFNIMNNQSIYKLNGIEWSSKVTLNSAKNKIFFWDRTSLKVWNFDTGKFIREIEYIHLIVNQDKSLIFLSNEDSLQLWDINSLKMIYDFKEKDIRYFVLSRDENKVIFSTQNNFVKILDLKQKKVIQTFEDSSDIKDFIFNEDETRILSWNENHLLRLWDVQNEKVLQRFQHESLVKGAILNQEKTKVLSWTENDNIKLWDIQSGELLAVLHHEDIEKAKFNNNSNKIISWALHGDTKFWDISSNKVIEVLKDNFDASNTVFNKNKSKNLFWNNDSIELWDLDTGKTLQTFEDINTTLIDNIVLSHDEKKMILWGHEHIQVRNVQGGKILSNFKHDSFIQGLVFNHDKTQVASWDSNGTIRLWSLDNGKLLHSFEHHRVEKVRFSEDETKIVSWSWDIQKTWEVSSGELLEELEHDTMFYSSKILFKNNKKTLSYGYDTITIRHIDEDKDSVRVEHKKVQGVKLSKNETKVLSWSNSSIKIQYPYSGIELGMFKHVGVEEALFNQEETRVLSWSKSSIKLWDIESGQLLLTIKDNNIQGAVLSKDEKIVYFWTETQMKKYAFYPKYNIEKQHYPLRTQVETGVFLLPSGEIRRLSKDEWLQKKEQYENLYGNLHK